MNTNAFLKLPGSEYIKTGRWITLKIFYFRKKYLFWALILLVVVVLVLMIVSLTASGGQINMGGWAGN
jgi:hypothetical protein